MTEAGKNGTRRASGSQRDSSPEGEAHQPASGREPALTADAIAALFDDLGLRSTRPRRLIAERLAEVAASGVDFAIEDLWRDLQAIDPRIGRATVYRAVDLLLREGVLDRVAFADGTHRYRLCGLEHHHHVTCVACHRVVEVDACLSPDLLADVARSTGFQIDGHAVELFGRCEDCR
jgi:Fe2+ or Zn2+ uptake regulation protein